MLQAGNFGADAYHSIWHRGFHVTLTICQCAQFVSFSIQLCWRATARRGVVHCLKKEENGEHLEELCSFFRCRGSLAGVRQASQLQTTGCRAALANKRSHAHILVRSFSVSTFYGRATTVADSICSTMRWIADAPEEWTTNFDMWVGWWVHKEG